MPFSIEEWQDVRETECDQHQRTDDPKKPLVGCPDLRQSADLAGFAFPYRSVDALPGKEQGNQRRSHEDRTVGLEQREVANPGTTEPQADQDQWTEAAGGCQDRRNPSGEEGATPVLCLCHMFSLSLINSLK